MSNKTILFADDSATMRTIMEKTFVAEPFDVVTVPSGEAAINQAKALRPDVIVVDAGMAGVSGYDVCQAVRQDTATGSIPLIIMSGVSNLYDEGRGESVGVTQHVKKPFDTTQLIQLITELSDRPREEIPEPKTSAEAPEPIASLESLSEPPLEPISIAPEDVGAELADVDIEDEELPEVTEEADSEPIPLTPEPKRAAESMSKIEMDGSGDRAKPETKTFGIPKSAAPKRAPAAAPVSDDDTDFGEVALDVADHESVPTPDVAPIEIEPPQSDTPSESFQVGTLAELAQMDGKARPLSSNAEPVEVAKPAETVVPAPKAVAAVSGMASAVRDKVEDATRNIAANVEGITVEQAKAIQTLTREVIERVVWEVVPDLAEVIIKEELSKLLEE